MSRHSYTILCANVDFDLNTGVGYLTSTPLFRLNKYKIYIFTTGKYLQVTLISFDPDMLQYRSPGYLMNNMG